MIYKAFQDKKLSALGLGTMRLPVVDGDNAKIDMAQTKQMVAYAMANGINYYDTAWGYHRGNSELAIGEALADYPRDSFYLATKFPGFSEYNMTHVEEIFEKQLEKCRVEYFDFYLFHCVCEDNVDGYLNPAYGIHAYLMEQKRRGRIRHLGFSIHGSMETMKKFLSAYGKDIEFCQIQLNYLDWELQDAKAKVALLNEMNIPIWVMEPVRGGRLAKLEDGYMERLSLLRPAIDAPEWAFRYLQTVPGVVMTLSGMSNMEQLAANIATYQEEKPLNARENEVLMEIAEDMRGRMDVPCTACEYCLPKCPMGLSIPVLIKLYNDRRKAAQEGNPLPELEEGTLHPEQCVGCRSCERACPQGIAISEVMPKLAVNLSRK